MLNRLNRALLYSDDEEDGSLKQGDNVNIDHHDDLARVVTEPRSNDATTTSTQRGGGGEQRANYTITNSGRGVPLNSVSGDGGGGSSESLVTSGARRNGTITESVSGGGGDSSGAHTSINNSTPLTKRSTSSTTSSARNQQYRSSRNDSNNNNSSSRWIGGGSMTNRTLHKGTHSALSRTSDPSRGESPTHPSSLSSSAATAAAYDSPSPEHHSVAELERMKMTLRKLRHKQHIQQRLRARQYEAQMSRIEGGSGKIAAHLLYEDLHEEDNAKEEEDMHDDVGHHQYHRHHHHHNNNSNTSASDDMMKRKRWKNDFDDGDDYDDDEEDDDGTQPIRLSRFRTSLVDSMILGLTNSKGTLKDYVNASDSFDYFKTNQKFIERQTNSQKYHTKEGSDGGDNDNEGDDDRMDANENDNRDDGLSLSDESDEELLRILENRTGVCVCLLVPVVVIDDVDEDEDEDDDYVLL